MMELIERQAALDAIEESAQMNLADINHHYLMGFQDAAEAVQNCRAAWRDPGQELPPDNGRDVLVVITGTIGDRFWEHGYELGTYSNDSGWYINRIEQTLDDSWVVNAWMPLPEWEG